MYVNVNNGNLEQFQLESDINQNDNTNKKNNII